MFKVVIVLKNSLRGMDNLIVRYVYFGDFNCICFETFSCVEFVSDALLEPLLCLYLAT